MDEGFIRNGVGAAARAWASEWYEGAPEKSVWAKTNDRNHLQVRTYHCAECGYLESYAY
jgi:hypothetical protein